MSVPGNEIPSADERLSRNSIALRESSPAYTRDSSDCGRFMRISEAAFKAISLTSGVLVFTRPKQERSGCSLCISSLLFVMLRRLSRIGDIGESSEEAFSKRDGSNGDTIMTGPHVVISSMISLSARIPTFGVSKPNPSCVNFDNTFPGFDAAIPPIPAPYQAPHCKLTIGDPSSRNAVDQASRAPLAAA